MNTQVRFLIHVSLDLELMVFFQSHHHIAALKFIYLKHPTQFRFLTSKKKLRAKF